MRAIYPVVAALENWLRRRAYRKAERRSRGKDLGPADYVKHQLYLNGYIMETFGRVRLPDPCRWIVMEHNGRRQFTNDPRAKGEICLILDDHQRHFWSVMSFLTAGETRELSRQLSQMTETSSESQEQQADCAERS